MITKEELELTCELLAEMKQTIAGQAAVIEKIKSSIGAWERAEADELQDAEAGLIHAMNIPTDSKRILAEWLDKVLGEPVGFMTADRQFRFETPRKDIKPVYFKPEKL